MSTKVLLDLFAGTGVGAGAQMLEWIDLGVEIDHDVQESRYKNNLHTISDTVWDFEYIIETVTDRVDGIWASPPCQTFSVAGKGAGNRALENIITGVNGRVWREVDPLNQWSSQHDPNTGLVLSPLTYTHILEPKFLVLEQVPSVLPIWEAAAPHIEGIGYNVWTGLVNAKDFGIAQDRNRAYLVATKGSLQPFLNLQPKEPVTMYEQLGWGFTKRPHPTLTGKVTVTRSATGTQQLFERAIERGEFVFRPDFDPRISAAAKSGIGSRYAPDSINITVGEALELQGYPKGFRLAGTKTSQQQQVGNAVPPVVARDILAAIEEGLNV